MQLQDDAYLQSVQRPIRFEIRETDQTKVVVFVSLTDDELAANPQLEDRVDPDKVLRITCLTSLDIDGMADLLKRNLEDIDVRYQHLFASNSQIPVPESSVETLLRELSVYGEEVWEKLVGDKVKKPEKASEDHWKIAMNFLRKRLEEQSQTIVIERTVKKHLVLFPWGIVRKPQKKEENAFIFDEFWGCKHQIHEEIGDSEVFVLKEKPKIVAAIDYSVDFDNVHEATDHPLIVQDSCEAIFCESSDQFLDELPSAEIVYHFGHAETHAILSSKNNLILQGNNGQPEELNASQIRRRVDEVGYCNKAVLIFLNGCETNALCKCEDDSFIGSFGGIQSNKIYYLTTTVKVPAVFAAQFAYSFMKNFLSEKKTVGESLRSSIWDTKIGRLSSPLGLLYTYYGATGLRVDNPRL